ncbi:MAG: glycosyltransferase [Bacteroidetes bacterium]|uniref:Glycosyltransferase n=1 Tax=Candidatus Gallipaludibacter merdavium TaxID=2840839 RepID=A0A9D9HUF9_9BACT|nr:glycosyltransferase [Candidatus Gallipaludibacter merdavium]
MDMDKMNLAPIVLFVYNRPLHTEQTLMALQKNDFASESELFIFADGPKENAAVEQIEKIDEVRKIIRKKQWCGKVHIIESEVNKGLADSIVRGVTEIVNRYGKIIVLEDDVVVQKGFLRYMNDALNIYDEEERVMHISAYMYPHSCKKISETFFYNLPYPGGGWATWKRAWKYFCNDANDLYKYFNENNLWEDFNTAGSDYLQYQLEANIRGELKTWFVKWHASILMKNGLTLYPHRSLTHNIGFDASGVHCGQTNKFDGPLVSRVKVVKSNPICSKEGREIILDFYKRLNQPTQRTFFQRIRDYLKRKLKVRNSSNIVHQNVIHNNRLGRNVVLASGSKIFNSNIKDYTYISLNANISDTQIGKFCSIGPNLLCGWGIHPTNGISTAPMFYSTMKQNGITYSQTDKIEERKRITIGNDVFIGANVTILDGVTVGDGAIIGAGAVVSKDIPPYAIAVGCPIKIIRYRFTEEQIDALLRIQWWNWDVVDLKEVERMFFDVDAFIMKYDK